MVITTDWHAYHVCAVGTKRNSAGDIYSNNCASYRIVWLAEISYSGKQKNLCKKY